MEIYEFNLSEKQFSWQFHKKIFCFQGASDLR